jgi:hypothetical protein
MVILLIALADLLFDQFVVLRSGASFFSPSDVQNPPLQ